MKIFIRETREKQNQTRSFLNDKKNVEKILRIQKYCLSLWQISNKNASYE